MSAHIEALTETDKKQTRMKPHITLSFINQKHNIFKKGESLLDSGSDVNLIGSHIVEKPQLPQRRVKRYTTIHDCKGQPIYDQLKYEVTIPWFNKEEGICHGPAPDYY